MRIEVIQPPQPPVKEVVISMSYAEAEQLLKALAPLRGSYDLYDGLGAALGHWGSR